MNKSVLLVLLCSVVRTPAATFYGDPSRGSPRGDGRANRPWRTIEEVLEAARHLIRVSLDVAVARDYIGPIPR